MDSANANVDVLDSRESLEEGTLYVVRNRRLVLVPRNDEEGMRRVRVTEDAYQVAMDIGQRMRKDLGGYKPDVSLVISAILLGGIDEAKAKQMVRQFVLRMFGGGVSDEDGSYSIQTSRVSTFPIEED